MVGVVVRRVVGVVEQAAAKQATTTATPAVRGPERHTPYLRVNPFPMIHDAVQVAGTATVVGRDACEEARVRWEGR